MKSERDEYADLIIDCLKDYMDIFGLEKLIAVEHRFTIGQIARRVIELKLREMLEKHEPEELAPKINLHIKTLKKKIKTLE
jgi:hypothetical protein